MHECVWAYGALCNGHILEAHQSELKEVIIINFGCIHSHQKVVYLCCNFSTIGSKHDRPWYSITRSCPLLLITGIATMGPRGAMAPSLLSYFSIVSMSWFTFAIVMLWPPHLFSASNAPASNPVKPHFGL